MMRTAALTTACVVGLWSSSAADAVTLSEQGGTTAVVVVADDATGPEKHAAGELAAFLEQVTGATFKIIGPKDAAKADAKRPRLLVGSGAATLADPGFTVDGLREEGLIVRTVGSDLILAGGRPRGTLYAVYTFLEDHVGCRWWSSKVSAIPKRPTLRFDRLDVRFVPTLEYREPFWFDGFNGDWAVRNKANGHREQLDAKRGGKHIYQGFVHTFFPLLPPQKYFKDHPEWYSEIDGKRKSDHTQLCLTNEAMRQELVKNLKARLKANPAATIASVSQNDWHGYCQCAKCRAIDEAEGSPSGSLLHFVNKVAADIEGKFPKVAISTLAYQYTRMPPKHVKPRDNVIVRLCSIECSFSKPLADERNKKFRDDIVNWSKICDRLYIWDYTTNFRHYIAPHPNLRVLGPNVKFFVEHGVKGIFEQGAYHSYGSEMAELRAWVLAKLLWNPKLDERKLIDEFLDGYYGPAAPHIRAYLEATHDAVEASGDHLGCFSPISAGFLSIDTLARGWAHLEKAKAAVAADDALRLRVEVAQLPVLYVLLKRWYALKADAENQGVAFPARGSLRDTYDVFMRIAQAGNVTASAEGSGLDVVKSVLEQPNRKPAGPPPGCENLPQDQWIDLQDAGFRLAREGKWAAVKADESASDKAAAWMPANHHEWAVTRNFAVPLVEVAGSRPIRCLVSVRVEGGEGEGNAFTCGIYDPEAKRGVAHLAVPVKDVKDGAYHTYALGAHPLTNRMYVWVAPVDTSGVKAIWVDRVWLVLE